MEARDLYMQQSDRNKACLLENCTAAIMAAMVGCHSMRSIARTRDTIIAHADRMTNELLFQPLLWRSCAYKALKSAPSME